MTEQEKFETEVRMKLAVENEKFNSILNAIQQQREDMRQVQADMKALQAKHEAEMKAMQEKQDAEMKAMQEKQDIKFHEINQRFYEKLDENQKEFTKQLHSNFIQTLLGVGAIMAAIGGLIVSVVK